MIESTRLADLRYSAVVLHGCVVRVVRAVILSRADAMRRDEQDQP
jgi:hypothetical protein